MGRRKEWGNLEVAVEPREFVPNGGAPFLPVPQIRTVRWPRGRIQDNAIWAGASFHSTNQRREPCKLGSESMFRWKLSTWAGL